MVYLEFVRIDGDEVVYNYRPEDETAAYGTISVNRVTRKRTLIKTSETNSMSEYYRHGWKRIDLMLDAGDLKQKAVAAWY